MKKQLFTLSFLALFGIAQAQTGNTGIGTTTPGSKLTVNGSFAATYNNITATTYTMQASDYYVAWNGSAAGTITLPTALAIGSGNFGGRVYNIKNTSTTSSLTVVAGGTELLDNQSGAGVANIALPPGYYAMIINKGTTTGTTWEVAIVGNSNTVPCSGFGARISGGSQPIAGGTNTKLLFPTEEWDQGGVFTPATSTFTAPQAGRYILTGSYKTGAASAPNSQDLILFKNNAVLAYGTSIGSSTISNVIGGAVSYIANLAAGDVIDLRIFITAGATTSIDQASFSAIKTDCSGGTASGGSITVGDYDWMKTGNVFPDSPGDTAQNIYHIGGSVGIGTASPNSNSSIDLGATNKGLLLNRVALSAANLPAPLSAHVAGMVVYNTATAGTAPNSVSPGMYYNDGVRWVRQPAGPMGLFVKSAGTQVWTGAATITDWAATTNDFGSAWNGSVFTVPAGMQGWYTIHTGYQTSANGATARTPFGHVQIMVNGAAVVIGTASVHVEGGTVNGVAPGTGSAVASMSYYLNVGDQVSVTGNHLTYLIPANTSTAISADPVHTYFSILKQ